MIADETPSDQLRDRVPGNRAKLWLLLEADRWLVSGLLLAVVFVVLLTAGHLAPAATETLRTTDSVGTLFQALVTATITGVTLVLTLNQLVLSQELGVVGDQQERMAGAMAFRETVAEQINAPVSPARPAQFLRALVVVAGRRADAIREAVGASTDDAIREDVADLCESIVQNADSVSADLDSAQFGEFSVVSAALDFNYSWKLFAARRLSERHGDRLESEACDALAELIAVLKLFGPAREHFKTLYFQWDLINLSRQLLAVSVPALVVSTVMIVFFDPAAYTGTLVGIDGVVLIVAAATTIAVVPFILLVAYVMRIATVAKRTLSIGSFILRETDDVERVTWE